MSIKIIYNINFFVRVVFFIAPMFGFFCISNSFAQNTPQLAAYDACEDSSKIYSKIASGIALAVKKINLLDDRDARVEALKQVMGQVNEIKDQEYIRIDKYKVNSRGESTSSRIYADTYARVYMSNFDYAVSLALSNPNYSEIIFKVEMEKDCKKTFR
jgi:hypothetical protein